MERGPKSLRGEVGQRRSANESGRFMKAFLVLLAMLFVCWADFPDRWSAELSGPKPAIVSGYSNRGTWRRPWNAEIQTKDGRTVTNSDNWTFKYLKVGENTEWTRANRVYVGGFLLRWSVYIAVIPAALALAAYNLIKLLNRRSAQNENRGA